MMRDYGELVKEMREGAEWAEKLCAHETAKRQSDAADAIEELLDELTTIRKQLPHWISVEDKPPKENGRYLVRHKRDINLGNEETVHEDEIRIMRFFVYDGWRYPIICNDHVRIVNEEVTHWMPLPAPPKGVE